MINTDIGYLWNKEVLDQQELIDPDDELHWESLATGWAIAKGMTPDDALDFGSHYMEYEESK